MSNKEINCINEEVERLADISLTHDLNINPKKSVVLVFGSKNLDPFVENILSIIAINESIRAKNLGYLRSKLTF